MHHWCMYIYYRYELQGSYVIKLMHKMLFTRCQDEYLCCTQLSNWYGQHRTMIKMQTASYRPLIDRASCREPLWSCLLSKTFIICIMYKTNKFIINQKNPVLSGNDYNDKYTKSCTCTCILSSYISILWLPNHNQWETYMYHKTFL